MNIAICDSFSRFWPKFHWVADGFRRCGHVVLELRTTEQLKSHLATGKGDLILFSQRPPVAPDDLVKLGNQMCAGPPWGCWIFDYLGGEYGSPGRMLLDVMPWQVFDVVFCKQPELRIGKRCTWLDQACPPWQQQTTNGKRPRPFDVLFAGTCTTEREELVQACETAGLKTVVAGNGWTRDHVGRTTLSEQTTDFWMQELFGLATISLGSNRPNDVPLYWSDRMWLSIAGGAMYVGPETAYGWDELWDDDWSTQAVIERCQLLLSDANVMAEQRSFQCELMVKNQYADRAASIENMYRFMEYSHG